MNQTIPLPVRVERNVHDGWYEVIDGEGNLITMLQSEGKANQIAIALNHFDKLVEALEDSTSLLKSLTSHYANEEGMIDQQIEDNKAALKAAGRVE